MSYAGDTITLGAVAYWRLDEDTGTVAVDQIGGIDGTHNANVTPGVTGLLKTGGLAASYTPLARTDTSVDVSLDTSLTGVYSVECIVQISAWLSGVTNLVTLIPSGFIGIGSAGRRFSANFGTETVTEAINITEFDVPHHLLATCDAGTLTLYVDGDWIGESIGDTSLTHTSVAFGSIAVGFESFVGILDEVALYQRTFTRSQAFDRYRAFKADSIILRSFSPQVYLSGAFAPVQQAKVWLGGSWRTYWPPGADGALSSTTRLVTFSSVANPLLIIAVAFSGSAIAQLTLTSTGDIDRTRNTSTSTIGEWLTNNVGMDPALYEAKAVVVSGSNPTDGDVSGTYTPMTSDHTWGNTRVATSHGARSSTIIISVREIGNDATLATLQVALEVET